MSFVISVTLNCFTVRFDQDQFSPILSLIHSMKDLVTFLLSGSETFTPLTVSALSSQRRIVKFYSATWLCRAP